MKVIMAAVSHHCDSAPPAESLTVSDVEELRECLRRIQKKCDGLERERDYHVTKANELSKMLEVRIETTSVDDKSKDSPSKQQQQELIHKTAEVAELNHEKDLLREQLTKSNQRIKELELDCHTNRKVLVELSQIFRSVTMGSGNHQDILHQMEATRINNTKDTENSKEADTDDFELVDEYILSPQQAFDLTLSTLREQVEALEDERQRYIGRIRTLQNYLEEQRRENEARELKITALEKQMEEFWLENVALKEFLDNSLDVLQSNEADVLVYNNIGSDKGEQDDNANRNETGNQTAAKTSKKMGRTGKIFGWRRRKEVV